MHERNDEIFLEPADCARILGITPRTVQLLEQRGVLKPAARTVRGVRLYRSAAVYAALETRGRRVGPIRVSDLELVAGPDVKER
jgi:hypothetical protein